MTVMVALMLVVFAIGYAALRRIEPEQVAFEPLTRQRTPAAARGVILGYLCGPLDDADLLEIEARFRQQSALHWTRVLVLPSSAAFTVVLEGDAVEGER